MELIEKRPRGFRKKPWMISFFSMVYLLLPVFTALQYFSMTGNNLLMMKDILGSEAFLSEWVVCWLAAAALYVVTTPSFILFILLSSYVILHKFSDLGEAVIYASLADFVLMAFWLWISCVLVITTLRIPYLNPKSRWWRQPNRYFSVLRGVLIHQTIHFPIVVLNVCRTGVFVKLDERLMAMKKKTPPPEVQGAAPDLVKEERRKIQLEDNPLISPLDLESARNHMLAYPDAAEQKVLLQLAIRPEKNMGLQWEYMTLRASVVWVAQPESEYAYGAGLHFQQVSKAQQKAWNDYLKRLAKAQQEKKGR